MTYFLDTNTFLRYFVKEGNRAAHEDCVNLITKIQNKKIKAYTSHLVLAEIAWTLKSYYKAKKGDILKLLRSIEGMSIFFVDRFQTTIAHELYQNNNVKYIDCLIASIPQVHNNSIVVISYDKDFDKLGVKRSEPSDV